MLDVTLAEPGLLVVSQAYYRGWQASVAGARLLRVDGFALGVALPAGEYSLALDYRPPLLLWSAAISALGLALLIGLFVIGGKRRPVSTG